MVEADLPNPDATRDFGHRLGRLLFPGAIIALVGQLGAGKTYLSRAIAEGLNIPDSRVVTSPTFVLVQEYEAGRLPIYHFDAYRLCGEAEFAELAPEDYFEGRGVSLVEWADRVPSCLPRDHLLVSLVAIGATSRRLSLEATGPNHIPLLAAVSDYRPG
jgi:tRNA threonylcarbamoyladenosine biosynthesis protein TsaE